MARRSARWSDTRIAIVVAVVMTLLVAWGVYGIDRISADLAEKQDRAEMIAEAGAASAADDAQGQVDAAARAERNRLIALASDALGVQLSLDVTAGVLPSAPVSWVCATPAAGSYSDGDRLMELRCTANLVGVDGLVPVAYRGEVDTVTDVATTVRAPDLDGTSP